MFSSCSSKVTVGYYSNIQTFSMSLVKFMYSCLARGDTAIVICKLSLYTAMDYHAIGIYTVTRHLLSKGQCRPHAIRASRRPSSTCRAAPPRPSWRCWQPWPLRAARCSRTCARDPAPTRNAIWAQEIFSIGIYSTKYFVGPRNSFWGSQSRGGSRTAAA